MNVQNLIICDSKVIYYILIEIKENLNCNLLFKTKNEISKIDKNTNNLIDEHSPSNLEKKITSDNIKLSPGKKRMLEFLKKNSK